MSWMQILAMLMPVIGALALGAFGLYLEHHNRKSENHPAE